jgi:hypothetical protein
MTWHHLGFIALMLVVLFLFGSAVLLRNVHETTATTLGIGIGDPLFDNQWYLQEERKVVVALLDSGLDLTHEDLADNLWVNPGEVAGNGVDDDGNGFIDDVHGADFIDYDGDPTDPCYGHGTATAGIVGAVRDNQIGIAGAADHVRLMPLRVLGCGGTGTEQGLVDAITYAANNDADVVQVVVLVSSAWNIPGFDQPGGLPAFCDAIGSTDLLFITPTGNEGLDFDTSYRYPTSCDRDNQIVVGASDEDGAISSFSGTGALVDIFAPAENITTTGMSVPGAWPTYDGTYLVPVGINGGSWAVPQVTAAAARLLWLTPEIDVPTFKERVLELRDANGILDAFRGESQIVPDTIPPAVTITAPNNGDTVTGNVTVSADASDNVGVVGVQFLLDGLNLNGEDAAAPYATVWDTTMVPDGVYSLSAIAQDAAGNSTAAGAVTVTVDNTSPPGGPVVHLDFEASPSGGGFTCTSCPALVNGQGDFTNDWLERPNAPWTSQFTIAAVVDIDTVNDRRPIASKQGNGERGLVFLASHYIGGRLRAEIWPSGAASPTLLNSTTPLGSGVHAVALTHDGTTARLYVDGVEEANVVVGLPRTNSQPLYIGRYYWSSGYQRFFDGRMDDVRIWDRALSAAEVVNL